MTHAERQHRFRVALAFGLVYVLWGSTYLGIRIVVEHIPPSVMGASRFLLAGLPMLGWCALRGKRLALTLSDFWRVLAIGVLLLTGGNVMVVWSEQYVPSGLAALIAAIVPIWVAVLESILPRGERLAGRGLAGLALGIAGLAVLMWPRLTAGGAAGHMQILGALGLVFASLSWASGSILSRRSQLRIDPFAATAWEMTLAGLVNLGIVLALGEHHRIVWTARGVGAILYLVVFGSWIGFTAYIWLLEHVPTSKVATYAYVNPVVAVFLGWLILHESVDVYIAAGTAVIIAGVALVNSSKMRKVAAPVAEPELPACESQAD
ncbi:MAG: EamA family transporter [Acidobacteriota bacterium]|nr:EamA family transporter [Acidobacteriota bacterium]